MKKYVLVCDDDKNLNQDVSSTLYQQLAKKGEDVDIISVFSRDEALDQLSKRYFSLAIIDLNLEGPPPMDWSRTGGVKVIKKIKDLNFNTKIIVISASPETELSFKLSKDHDIDAYIQKGKSTSSFRELITKSLHYIDSNLPPVPESTISTLSGLSGEERTIWETNVCTILNIEGKYNGLLNIADEICRKYYPFYHLDTKKLFLDGNNKVLTGKIWSYRSSEELYLYIYNTHDKYSNTDKRNTVDKIEINNTTILIKN